MPGEGLLSLLRESLRAALLKVVLSQAHPVPREKGLLSSPLLEPISLLQAKGPRAHPSPRKGPPIAVNKPDELTCVTHEEGQGSSLSSSRGWDLHFLRESVGHQDEELEGGLGSRKKGFSGNKKGRQEGGMPAVVKRSGCVLPKKTSVGNNLMSKLD